MIIIRSIKSDKTVDFNRPHTVFIDRENKKELVTDTTLLLIYNISSTEAEKIMKYENLALEIKNIWKCNSVFIHALVISTEGVVTKNLLKYWRI